MYNWFVKLVVIRVVTIFFTSHNDTSDTCKTLYLFPHLTAATSPITHIKK